MPYFTRMDWEELQSLHTQWVGAVTTLLDLRNKLQIATERAALAYDQFEAKERALRLNRDELLQVQLRGEPPHPLPAPAPLLDSPRAIRLDDET